MQYKSLSVELKADQARGFRATFATLNVVDHDLDVTVPGAFQNGERVVISAYQHGSWDGALPVGAGVINSNATKAWVDGQFFDTAAGVETYKTVKGLGKLARFSYGYDVLEASFDPSELAA